MLFVFLFLKMQDLQVLALPKNYEITDELTI